MSCKCILQSGKRKGEQCGKTIKANNRCGIHQVTCVTKSPARRKSPAQVAPPRRKSPARAAPPFKKKACEEGKIRSPISNRCISIGGKAHKELLNEQKATPKESTFKSSAIFELFEPFHVVREAPNLLLPANDNTIKFKFTRNYINLILPIRTKSFKNTHVMMLNKEYQILMEWNKEKHAPVFQLSHRDKATFSSKAIRAAIRKIKKLFNYPHIEHSLQITGKGVVEV